MHSHSHPHADHEHSEDAEEELPVQIERLMAFLQSQFGSVVYVEEEVSVKPEPEEPTVDTKSDPDEEVPSVKVEPDVEDSKTSIPQATDGPGQAKPPLIRIKVDGDNAEIALSDLVGPDGVCRAFGLTLLSKTVYTASDALRQRVESTLRIALRTVTPFAAATSRPFVKGADSAKRIAIAA